MWQSTLEGTGGEPAQQQLTTLDIEEPRQITSSHTMARSKGEEKDYGND